ncbi:hypothetical protein VP01_3835g1 [Puccinia sorghi]|uniref:Uncharacterized protein n=1 Tax=Puccinia sorghi TaxID=27349 RepID=A0A0L6UTB0_9BASI|nr:hypothetical protein VP01_3835g1 [Puccinia sorghi]
MADPINAARDVAVGASDGFQQAILKTVLEMIPQLMEEYYSIWRDKSTALLKLWRTINAELVMLFLSKMDSMTHINVVTAENRGSAQKLWLSIKERFASSQSSNRERIFNNFLYIKFEEDAVETFFTDIKVVIKKLVDSYSNSQALCKTSSIR